MAASGQLRTNAPQQTAPYSMTSSARPSSGSGIVRPSAFAVEIDNQLDLCGLLHWQIDRLLALENPTRVDADKAMRV